MSNKRDDSVGEEASALGQRAKGAVKDAVGAVTGDRSLEREGERENATAARGKRRIMYSMSPMASAGPRSVAQQPAPAEPLPAGGW